MTITEYLESVKDRLLFDPIVKNFEILRERMTSTDGYLRVKALLNDGGFLEFSEYVQHNSKGKIEIVTYSYHWADSNAEIIMRWDNTPHFPSLPGFPHHIHDGRAKTVHSGVEVNIFEVLDEIAGRI
jgi:hypothetical protein